MGSSVPDKRQIGEKKIMLLLILEWKSRSHLAFGRLEFLLQTRVKEEMKSEEAPCPRL